MGGRQWVPKLHLNQSQPQLKLSEPKIHLSTWAFHLVKNRKKQQVRGCRRSQNSTRSKRGKKHRPRAAVGTKNASESKPNTTAVLGVKNPPGEKQKKTTGPRLSSEPKFGPIKKGKKPPPAGCRGGQKCIGIKTNLSCSSRSQKIHLVKNRKKRQDRGCRRSQNSTRSKRGKNHRPRAVVGTKNTSESKPSSAAALGVRKSTW